MASFAAAACSSDLAALVLAAPWEIPTDSRFPKKGGVKQFESKSEGFSFTERLGRSFHNRRRSIIEWWLNLVKAAHTCIPCSRASSGRGNSRMIGNERFFQELFGCICESHPIPYARKSVALTN